MIKKTVVDSWDIDTSWDKHMTSVVNWRVKLALTRELNGKLHISMHGRIWYIYVCHMIIAQ